MRVHVCGACEGAIELDCAGGVVHGQSQHVKVDCVVGVETGVELGVGAQAEVFVDLVLGVETCDC